jgi:hypothetical protein
MGRADTYIMMKESAVTLVALHPLPEVGYDDEEEEEEKYKDY